MTEIATQCPKLPIISFLDGLISALMNNIAPLLNLTIGRRRFLWLWTASTCLKRNSPQVRVDLSEENALLRLSIARVCGADIVARHPHLRVNKLWSTLQGGASGNFALPTRLTLTRFACGLAVHSPCNHLPCLRFRHRPFQLQHSPAFGSHPNGLLKVCL